MSKPIWEKKNPKRRHKKMSRRQKGNARRAAARHGRKRPSLVDNINASKS